MKKTIFSAASDSRALFFMAATVLAVVAIFGERVVLAAEWRFEPVVRVGYEFDDNATLNAVTAPIEIEGYILEGSATFGSATERTTFDITPMVRSRNYDNELFDANDGFLTVDWNHKGLKSNFRLRANYAQESVRTAERADADPDIDDPDEIVGDDTGTALGIEDRDRLWVMPQWSYDLSEKTTFGARATYTDVDYDDQLSGFFTPYSDARLEASLSRGFSTRTRAYIEASARRYEPDVAGAGMGSDLDGIALNIGFDRNLTETTRFRAEVGAEESEPEVGQSDTNAIWDINLVNKLETITVLAQVTRSVNASGSGRVSLRDSFNLNLRKQFSARTNGGLGVRAYSTDRLDNDPGVGDERDYIQFRARFGYAFTRNFLVELDYRYTYIDRSGQPDTAKSNSVIVWLTWQPTAMTASR